MGVGGFDERFLLPLHEDIELGWRLQRSYGLQVQWVPHILSWHDHALTPEDYFRREHSSGTVAKLALELNREFHDETWGWCADAQAMLATLQALFQRGPLLSD